MNIIISNKSGVPIYEQIIREIKNEIIKGTLEKNELLPSIRSLAKELRVSVITSKKAYDELEKQGFIYTIRGKGTFVADNNINFIKENKKIEIEETLIEVIETAKDIGLTATELNSMIKILWG